MPYRIGVTPANMMELTDLGLCQPISNWIPFAERRQRGDGSFVGQGRPSFTWRFDELSLSELGVLLHYVTVGGELAASNTVYVRTRRPQSFMADRVFQDYRAIMMLPIEPDDLEYGNNRRYYDVEVRFIGAVEI